jgi:hypothetical protein
MVMLLVGHGQRTLGVESLKGNGFDKVGTTQSPVVVNLETWDPGFSLFSKGGMDCASELLTIVDAGIHWDAVVLEDIPDCADVLAGFDVDYGVTEGSDYPLDTEFLVNDLDFLCDIAYDGLKPQFFVENDVAMTEMGNPSAVSRVWLVAVVVNPVDSSVFYELGEIDFGKDVVGLTVSGRLEVE